MEKGYETGHPEAYMSFPSTIRESGAADAGMINREFAVYLNDQYLGKKPMMKNQGQDLVEMDQYLKEKELEGYTITNQGGTIRIQMKDDQNLEAARSQLTQYLKLY
ncbi:MAG: hypothetical protein ACOX6S_07130 [Clostridia bacterium]